MKQILSITLLMFCANLFGLKAQDFFLTKLRLINHFEHNVVNLKYSPKGTYLSVSVAENTIELYDNKFNKIWTYQGNPRHAAGTSDFFPEEDYMVFGKFQGFGDIALMRLSDKKVVQKLSAHKNYLNSLDLDPKGEFLASGGLDTKIKFWQFNKEQRFEALPDFDIEALGFRKINDLAFSPDSKLLVAGGDGKHLLVFQQTKKEGYQLLKKIPYEPVVSSLAFHNSGNYLVLAASGEYSVWEVGKKGLELKNKYKISGQPYDVEFSPSGNVLAITQYNGFSLHHFKAKEGELSQFDRNEMHSGSGMAVVFSPNKQLMVSSDTNRQLWVWQRSDAPEAQISKTEKELSKGNNNADIVESEEFDIDLDQNNTANNYLLIIGIDKYKYWNPLGNATKDAREVKKVLQERYQFSDQNTFELYNEAATAKNILAKIAEVRERLSADDRLLIYFSGHGHYNSTIEEGFWIPVDAHKGEETEYLPNSTLLKYLKALPAKHIFLIADACFSGALFASGSRGYVENAEAFKSRWALTSGRLEYVSDGRTGENSPFAKYLIKFMQDNKKPRLLGSEIIQYVKVAVGNNSEQTPIGNPLKNAGDEGGEFVFYLK